MDTGPNMMDSVKSRPHSEGTTGLDERRLRNASIVDQEAIGRRQVVVVGVGAIGSHLVEVLGKLGVLKFVLIDPDEVDTINLGVQGFYEGEVGLPKVDSVGTRLRLISSMIEVEAFCEEYRPDLVPSASVVFACVDSVKVRRQVFRHFCERDWPVFFDGRMAAESLRVFCVERNEESIQAYRSSLFPSHQAYRESCTARATIYAATMAAAILCAQFKRWAMNQSPEHHVQFDLMSMDCFL